MKKWSIHTRREGITREHDVSGLLAAEPSRNRRAERISWVRTWGYGGREIEAQHRLRYKTFIEEQYWGGVRHYRGLEFDQYDTPAAHYLACMDSPTTAAGCVRAMAIKDGCMVQDNWPRLLTTSLTRDGSVWEFTRLCVNQSLELADRRRIRNRLICGLIELSLRNDVEELVGVMHPKLWTGICDDANWPARFLGAEDVIDGGIVRAGCLKVSVETLKTVRSSLDVLNSVLI